MLPCLATAMSTRTVLLFSDAPVFSGAERYLDLLAKALPRDRYRPTLALSELGALDGFARQAKGYGIPVLRLPRLDRLGERGPFLKLLRFFATKRFDVMHFNLTDPRACNGAMTAARFARRGKFVVTEHLPQSPFDAKKTPYRHRVAMRNTAWTIVNSESYRESVEARPDHRGQVVVIPNGIEDLGPINQKRRLEAKARLTMPAGGRTIGWVGRVTAQKDPAMLLDVMKLVLPKRLDATFVIIGDGDHLPQLQRGVKDANLSDRVRFYGHRQDVPDLLPAMDLLINTSTYEGMPFSILEAMVQGIPVVARGIPGMADLVGPGATGWIPPKDTPEAFCRTVLDALKYPERLASYGRAARERTLTLFSVDRLCERTMTEVYDRI
jgi:glycosyltransferase involved in cell wall biosynthesis